MPAKGLLHSQIGYDFKDPMRAIYRGGSRQDLSDQARFSLRRESGNTIACEGPARYWGEVWQSHWWELDFSGIDQAGTYRLILQDGEKTVQESDPFEIGPFVLWQKSMRTVALDQMERRSQLARNHKGWKDCGSDFREANSHATTIIGLCDLLNAYTHLSDDDTARLAAQIVQGCDYLCACQDKAEQIGKPRGALVHEIPNYMVVIPGDVAQSVVALTKSSRMLSEIEPEKSAEYLRRAQLAFDYLLKDARPYGPSGFSHLNHGAPPDFRVPEQWMTRDLLMFMWGGLELWISGQSDCQEIVTRLARDVMARQIQKEQAQDAYYGHFQAFLPAPFSEKANTHHHIGHDTGSTFPFWILPFIEMCGRWQDHPDAGLWDQTIRDFAYGFFLPACSGNPFYLMPEGHFGDEGILHFCGPWHGINASLALGGALAAKLEGYLHDAAFRQIATGNLQWIAGLHAGITRESFGGCVLWQEDVPADQAISYSQIYGVGHRCAQNWTNIPGSIANGFSVNPQFELSVAPSRQADQPLLYTDEDWIPHAAGWISGLVALRGVKTFADL